MNDLFCSVFTRINSKNAFLTTRLAVAVERHEPDGMLRRLDYAGGRRWRVEWVKEALKELPQRPRSVALPLSADLSPRG